MIVILFHVLLLAPSLSHAQKSGIEGKLFLLATESNLSQPNQAVEYSGVPLEIFVYSATTNAEVDMEEGAITKIYSNLISRKFSKWDGSFKVKLPPGEYSVFAFYKNRYYGNLQDKNGTLSPAIVKEKKKAWVTITINYSSFH